MKKTVALSLGMALLASLAAPLVLAQSHSLSGTQWELVSPSYPGLEKAPYLRFENGRLGAGVGCNSMSGPFTQNGGGFKVLPMISTMKACAPTLMDAEAKYGAALQGATGLELSADGRELTLSGTETLQFRLTSGAPPMLEIQPPTVVGTDGSSPSGFNRNGQFRIARGAEGFGRGTLFVVRYGAEQKIAENVWSAWPSTDDGFVLYAGSDGAGGYENEGQSLWIFNWKTGQKRKLSALPTKISNVFETSANSQKLYVVTSQDGGAGFKHVTVVHPTRGQIWGARHVQLNAIRNQTLALQELRMQGENFTPGKMRFVPLARVLMQQR